jgi:alkanesulfonate monooxygenase SsuD/methylene tetrahydromethanopterin reductase-like flavin-dependent oxidoreductase (luciferase family)
VHFGLFNLMGYRHAGTSVRDICNHTIEQVRAAEAAGFEIAWFAEHHFSNYSACPSPLMMVARLAGETSRIKLAPGVVVVPLYSPARLLGEIGLCDALTNGRLVLGAGAGYQPYEFERFNEDLSQSADKLTEFMEILELAFTQETFSYQGTHYQLPETHIATRPAGGIPDIWFAGDNAQLSKLAAQKGYGAMVTARHFTPELLAAARERIEDIYTSLDLDPATLRFGALRHVCVTDDRDEAMSFIENCRYQVRLSQALRRREELMDGAMLIEKPYPNEPSLDEMAAQMLVGPAETVAERMAEQIRRARPAHMLLQFQSGAFPHAAAMRSIDRFASDVQPLLEKELGPLAAL